MTQITTAALLAKVEALEVSLTRETAERRRLEKALADALEQQTATSEILDVISGSPNDVQPVFEAIVRSGARLCEATICMLVGYAGETMSVLAMQNIADEGGAALRRALSTRPTRASNAGRSILERRVVHSPDVLLDEEYGLKDVAETARYRAALAVPMLRDGVVIGTVVVGRAHPGPFSERQIQLLKTFADQAVIAIENVRLFKELEARNRDLTEALAQQTATAEILKSISASPTDYQPVFNTIVRNAGSVCGAVDSILWTVDGDDLVIRAHHGPLPGDLGARQPVQGSVAGRAVIEARVVHVEDLAQADDFPFGRDIARRLGWRTTLGVPLLREGVAVGAILIRRSEVRPFTPKEIELLQTFADQAVIAIENVRLFTELEARNRDLTEALEQQTATSEVLQAISSSPTNLQPVLETIAENAARVCGATDGVVHIVEGGELPIVAHYGLVGGTEAAPIRRFPLTRGSVVGRAVIERRAVHVEDVAVTDEVEFPLAKEIARQTGHRTGLAIPLLREGIAIGALVARRLEVRPFTDKQIALLKTFADQAVIAIENVRLFKELEARNAELSEALEQQTATADILRAISQAQTDMQPVFEVIADSAMRLLGAWSVMVYRCDGEHVRLAAARGGHPGSSAAMMERLGTQWRSAVESAPSLARTVLARTVQKTVDVEMDMSWGPESREQARERGWRSAIHVPMLRGGDIVGVIAVSRAEPGEFSPSEIALLQTFADQAVIAVENARLLSELHERTGELQRSVGQLTALGEVGRAVSSTLDLQTVLTTIVARAVQLSGLDGGVVFEYDDNTEEFAQRAATETGGALAEARRTTRIRKGEGALGQTAITLEPVQVPDIAVPGAYESRLRENLLESGIRAILAVPMVREGQLIGCLGVTRNRPGEFPAATIELLRTFATQSALAIQNARLFHEIEDKSRQLEAASQHKSEFLANMSHELRTPLNAVIGFSEVLLDRMFGEVNEKQAEYLQDILASGRHLLSLINDILDLSKIEAGRMELVLAPFHVPAAIDNAVTLIRERAARHGIALHVDVDGRLGEWVGDERKIKQVLLNLLSNAVKFTPEGGRIGVTAVLADGAITIAVSDTGIGIAPEDQGAIFEEFRQVGGNYARKVEGTGLGLTLTKKFVELHGGRIWVESDVGLGSTFTFALPIGS